MCVSPSWSLVVRTEQHSNGHQKGPQSALQGHLPLSSSLLGARDEDTSPQRLLFKEPTGLQGEGVKGDLQAKVTPK